MEQRRYGYKKRKIARGKETFEIPLLNVVPLGVFVLVKQVIV